MDALISLLENLAGLLDLSSGLGSSAAGGGGNVVAPGDVADDIGNVVTGK